MLSLTGIKILMALGLLAGAIAAASAYRNSVWQSGYDEAVSERAKSDAAALQAKVKFDAAQALKNDSINAKINKETNEKLEPVIRTIYVDRVRVGPGLCGSPKTEDSSSGYAADTGTGLVSQRTEEDIRALEVKVEKAFAAGNACQTWAKENGHWP